MRLGLSLCLPLLEAKSASLCGALLETLARRVRTIAFVRGPEQVDPGLRTRYDVRALADLPPLLDDGSVEVPVHVLADDLHHAHQVRFALERPGVLVLLDEELPALERALGEAEGLAGRLSARAAVTIRADRSGDVESAAAALADRILSCSETVASAGPPSPAPPAGGPAVEVVILAYNARDLVGEAIQSALVQDYGNLRVTVVDNASADGTAAAVRERFPEVRLIESRRNLGFAGGNNLAIEESDADFVVLLNQDAVARRDWITELVRAAQTSPDVAAVGSKMLLRRCPTILNSTGIAMNPLGFCYDRDIGRKDLDPSPTPQEVLGACGGAVLLRRETLARIGALEEGFFMYFEDLDLCWRMWLTGHRVLYAPLAVVVHDWHGDLDDGGGGAESEVEGREKTIRRRVLCERNRLQCLLRNYEVGTLARILPRARRYDRVRLSWVRDAIARGENVEYFRKVGRAIRGAWRWNLARLPFHFARRRRIQRLREVSDRDLWRLFGDWEGEPSFLGDLYAICDRHSARGAAVVRMGNSDARCLGPGWHAPEPLPDGGSARWTRDRAWIYLRPARSSRRLALVAAAGPKPVALEVVAELYGRHRFELAVGERRELSFLLERDVEAGRMLEVRIDATTFRPSREGIAPDDRDLGARVEEVRLEPVDRQGDTPSEAVG